MSKSIIESVFLNNEDVLVKHNPDYFKQKEEGKMDTSIAEHIDCKVGTIVAKGSFIPEDDLIGSTIYYRPQICDTVNIKGYGIFDVVVFSTKLFVLDERDQ